MGDVFIGGGTFGSLSAANAGNEDAFSSRYDGNGNRQWLRQLGTADSERTHAITADALGNVFIAGPKYGRLPGPGIGSYDAAFIAKYSRAGALLWNQQLGNATSENPLAAATDKDGNVYVTGQTFGSFGGPNQGSGDVFLCKYDTGGTLQWVKQLGSSGLDVSRGLVVDGNGNSFISGWTTGDLAGANAGIEDIFVSKFDVAGNLLWTKQFGTTDYDEALDVAVDLLGNIYVSGFSNGALGGPNAGGSDAFIAKLSEVPEPTTSAMLGCFALASLRRRHGQVL